MTDRSAVFCQAWRKIFLCPVVKFVSKASPLGIAEHGKVPSACWGLATAVLSHG